MDDLGKSAMMAGWTEWNDRFRDTIRRLLSGEVGQGLAPKDAIEEAHPFSVNHQLING